MSGFFTNVLLLLAAFFISSVCFLIKRVYWHPLSQFPGPPLAATTSFYQFYKLWNGQEGPWYRNLHLKYGSVVRCGPNHLSFNDPAMVPVVYHRKVNKTNFHQEFSCPAAVFNQKDHLHHAAAKRRFGFAYSLNRILQMEETIDQEIGKWVASLDEQARKNPQVDWELWTRYFSFDVITALSFGEPIGFLDSRSDVRGLITNMDKSMYRQKLSLYPPVAWFARNTVIGRRMFISRRADKSGLGLFMAEIHRTIQERIHSSREKLGTGKSMLDQWLSTKSADGQAIPVTDIEDQILMDMLAGPDSISLMTTNLVFLMTAHPLVLKRAQREIDEAIRTDRLSATSPEYNECRRLPFVDACVREGLRIVASTFPRRRSSPPGMPCHLDGKFVPPGTSFLASACEIGRHRDLYGDDADDFRPDRWLEASEEQLRLWETLDVHWGFGVRKCLGKHIGSMVLYKSTVLLLHRFNFQLEDGTSISVWSHPSSTMIRMMPRGS